MKIQSHPHQPTASDVPLERLANNKALTQQQKIGEASRQFEAILLRQILDAAQKPVISSKLSNNSTSASIYRDMVTNQLADSISKSGGFGLAATFTDQLSPHPKKGTEQHAPHQHPGFSSDSTRVTTGHVPRRHPSQPTIFDKNTHS